MRATVRRWAAAAAALAVLAGAPPLAAAQFVNDHEIQAVRAITPSCRQFPDAPWVGRVSGSVEDLLDNWVPISFVGCFYDQASCERWKSRASGAIPGVIRQYTCTRRF